MNLTTPNTISPSFLYIGPDKSGSTWLYEVLRQHPACYVPDCKDIYFFDRYYSRGLAWYAKRFASASSSASAVGELSHDYLYSSEAAQRIRSDLPRVKLLTILREPVERAFSHYLHWRSRGWTSDDFETAIEKHEEFLSHSSYYRHLKVYFELFREEQIGVFLFDTLKHDPESLGTEIFHFLDLSPDKAIDFNKRVMVASRARNATVARYLRRGANAARSVGLTDMVGRAKRSRLAQSFFVPYEDGEKPELSPRTRERLTDYFRNDVERLSDLIGLDLSMWSCVETKTR